MLKIQAIWSASTRSYAMSVLSYVGAICVTSKCDFIVHQLQQRFNQSSIILAIISSSFAKQHLHFLHDQSRGYLTQHTPNLDWWLLPFLRQKLKLPYMKAGFSLVKDARCNCLMIFLALAALPRHPSMLHSCIPFEILYKRDREAYMMARSTDELMEHSRELGIIYYRDKWDGSPRPHTARNHLWEVAGLHSNETWWRHPCYPNILFRFREKYHL